MICVPLNMHASLRKWFWVIIEDILKENPLYPFVPGDQILDNRSGPLSEWGMHV